MPDITDELKPFLKDHVSVFFREHDEYGLEEILLIDRHTDKKLLITANADGEASSYFTTEDEVPDYFFDPPEEKPIIENLDLCPSGGKDHSLNSSLSVLDISKRLPGVAKRGGTDGKTKHEWWFTYKGEKCAIWDYKGDRWSASGPYFVFSELDMF